MLRICIDCVGSLNDYYYLSIASVNQRAVEQIALHMLEDNRDRLFYFDWQHYFFQFSVYKNRKLNY